MQFVRTTGTAALFLLLGTLVPAYAQQDQRNERQGKTERQQGRQQQGAPPAAQQQRTQRQSQQPQARSQQQRQGAQQPQQQRVQQSQQQRVQQPQQQRAQQTQQQRQGQFSQQARQQQRPQRTRQQAVAWQQQRGWQQQGAWQGGSTWQQSRARRWDSEHRTWAQRGGYGGYYIPQSSFGLYFGSQHYFRMRSLPAFYMGYPRFSYGGYSFLLLDPWPEYWGSNWYYTDDVYVDYDDGYYLYNHRYPNVRLAITVAL